MWMTMVAQHCNYLNKHFESFAVVLLLIKYDLNIYLFLNSQKLLKMCIMIYELIHNIGRFEESNTEERPLFVRDLVEASCWTISGGKIR